MVRPAEILTAHARGDITRALAKAGKWKGSRRGFRFVFGRAIVQKGPVILWSVHHKKELIGTGVSETIFGAADEIGVLVGRRQLADRAAKG